MKASLTVIIFFGTLLCCEAEGPKQKSATAVSSDFPRELVRFSDYDGNPVFGGTGKDTWDREIRERGFILKEKDGYHLWYSGYNTKSDDNRKLLGYATSTDGFKWSRHSKRPVFAESWVEDMVVVKNKDTYYMFAEPNYVARVPKSGEVDPEDPDGTNGWRDLEGFPVLLTSKDKIHWEKKWAIDIRTTKGQPVFSGAYGTPTVFIENGKWYLFYERGDLGIWLATSDDLKVWTNVQDDPVIRRGPASYDKKLVAMNQVIKHEGRYFAYYHGYGDKEKWGGWTTNVAVSEDLVHWEKYSKNPIVSGDNSSSGILVHDGEKYRLYTMHPDVRVRLPVK